MRIICGAQGVGKTTELLKILKSLPENAKAFLIVPEQFTYETERLVLDGSSGCVMNTLVVSLSRLASMIAAKSGVKVPDIVSEQGKGMIIKHLSRQSAKKMSLFRAIADKKGFSDNVAQFFSELKREGKKTEDLIALSESAQDEHLKSKLSDIIPIYSSYCEMLGEDCLDGEDFFDFCADLVEKSEIVSGAYIFFDGFHSFNASQTKFITRLISSATDAFFTLTYEAHPFFSITQKTLQAIRDMARLANKPEETSYLTIKKNSPEEIAYLAGQFISDGSEQYKKDCERVYLSAFDTIEQEVTNAALFISNTIREKKARYCDFIVSVSDFSKYAPVIEQVFEGLNVPCFMDRHKQIAHTSSIRALLFLLRSCSDSSEAFDRLSFAKTGYAGLTHSETEQLENYALAFGIKRSMWLKPFHRNDAYESYDLDSLNEMRLKLIGATERLKKAFDKCTLGSQLCEQLNLYLISTGFYEHTKEIAQEFFQRGDYENANIYSQIYNIIIAMINQAHRFFSSEAMSAGELADCFEYAFYKVNLSTIPDVAERVRVGDVLRSRTQRVRYMIILGANEGSFPDSASAGSLFTEREKSSLIKLGLNIESTRDYVSRKELFMIYTLISSPSQGLYISRYSKSSQEELEPSYIFEQLERMFPNRPSPAYELDKRIVCAKGAFDILALEINKRTPLSLALYNYFSDNPLYSDYAKTIDYIKNYSFTAGLTELGAYRTLLSEPFVLSVTRLQKYAGCPFAFFMEYILKPKKRDELKVMTYDVGSVLHRVVEMYSRKVIGEEIRPSLLSEEHIRELSDSLCEQALGELSYKRLSEVTQSRYLKAKLKNAAACALSIITNQLKTSGFKISSAETDFGPGKAYPALTLALSEGEAYLQGTIDRSDSLDINDESYIRIIDYKTGTRKSEEFDPTKLFYGLALQLPLYMASRLALNQKCVGVMHQYLSQSRAEVKNDDALTVAKALEKQNTLEGLVLNDERIISAMGTNPLGGSVVACSSRNSNYLSEGELRGVSDFALNKAKELSGGIYSGEIAPSPYSLNGQSPCSYCDYSFVCFFSESLGCKYRRLKKQDMSIIKQDKEEAEDGN